MSRTLIINLIVLLGGVFYSTGGAAQTDSIGWKDIEYIKQASAWLTSYNAAGLRNLPVNKISIAEVFANKKDGKFVNYYESDNSYQLGAEAESYYRLNPKIVFYGKVSYSYFKGKHMGGSAFIDPYYNSFDIVEYADSTRGNKSKETYNLVGAVSADIYKGLTLGGKIDYTAINYAKHKDLRHKNKMLDMFVTAGLNYKINSMFEVGGNYYYRRSTEGLEFAMYGTTDRQYNSLISYGAFYGSSELFGESGYTKSGEEKPMFNSFHGGSLQLDVEVTPQISLFNEFTYKSRDGYYGKRSSRTVVYSEHKSDILEYRGVFSFSHRKDLHTLTVNVENEKLENFENIYRSETSSGGSTDIIYYGNLKVADKEFLNAKAEYTGNLGVTDFNPTWVLKASVEYQRRKQTVSVYPYFRKQNLSRTGFNLSADRNFVKGMDMYTISLGASYLSGSGVIKNDGIYAMPSESQSPPPNIDRYLEREYEYLTNDRIKGDVGFRYSRLFSKIGVKGYASVNYSLTKASDVIYLAGDTFNEFTLKIGCTF